MKDRWAHMLIMKDYRQPLMGVNPDGHPLVLDSHGGPHMLRLRCDCGHEWEIEAEAFPGRRALRSCGRFLCPHTPKPRAKRERGSAYCVYLPMKTASLINDYAIQHGVSFSRAIDELITAQIVSQLLNS